MSAAPQLDVRTQGLPVTKHSFYRSRVSKKELKAVDYCN